MSYVCEIEGKYLIIIKTNKLRKPTFLKFAICEIRKNPGPKIEGVASIDAAHLCSILSLSKPPAWVCGVVRIVNQKQKKARSVFRFLTKTSVGFGRFLNVTEKCETETERL